MRTLRFSALPALLIVLIGTTAPLAAQEGAVGSAEIEAALDARAAEEDADRAAVRAVLQTAQARTVAEAMGVDADRLLDAAEVVDGQRLATMAEHARAIEDQLAGGQSFTITATTLIVILLIVIVVILIAD